MLKKQKIKTEKKIKDADFDDYLRQKTNKIFPFIPFNLFIIAYEEGEEIFDSTKYLNKIDQVREKYEKKIAKTDSEKKIFKLEEKKEEKINKISKNLEEGNLLMRWGEPLAILDSSNIKRSVAQMQLYLQTIGFFNGSVNYEVKVKNRKARVFYIISPEGAYYLDSIYYTIQDTSIKKIIVEHKKNSLLQSGERYIQSNFSGERERIEDLLKNHGYFNFNRQYVNYKVHISADNNFLDVNVILSPPPDGSEHKIYTIDSITYISQGDIIDTKKGPVNFSGVYDNITFTGQDNQATREVLARRIFLRPGDVYNQKDIILTYRRLSDLDMFKFVNINFDTSGTDFKTSIVTSRLQKYQTSHEIGLGINLSQNIPGPFYNFNFRVRDIFGGLEMFDINGRIGFEGVSAATNSNQLYQSQEAAGNLSLSFPQFLLPASDRFRLKYFSRLNPKTKLLTGINYINRPEYVRTNYNGSINYTWQGLKNTYYSFSPSDISLIESEFRDPEFEETLDEAFKRTFEPSFVSSMIFFTIFTPDNYNNLKGQGSYLKTYFEVGGLITSNWDFRILEDLERYRFYKLYFDYRKNQYFSERTSLAYRINAGFALPFGGESRALPFEKYFFIGGSNSVRAWRPRRLGPGSYTPLNDQGIRDYRFEQPGEIIFEGSVELRQKLVGFLEGAFFIDIGNIWNVTDGQDGQFDINNFYREIAVGTGLGLRFDFTFVIVRFDVGVKVFDPASPLGQRYVLDEIFSGSEKEITVFNIGIGYPF